MTKHLILAILILALGACSKDDGSNTEVIGNASALKNGIEWNSYINYFSKNKPFNIGFDIGIVKYNEEGLPREGLSFFRLLNNFDSQAIYLTNSQIENDSTGVFYSTILEDGDVLGDIYELDTTATNNFIQITNYNSERAEIKGKFNVSLVLTRDDGYGDVPPQTLEFTNGEFTVKVEREWFE